VNLLAVNFNFGSGERALELATELETLTTDENLRAIAGVSRSILQAKTESDIDAINRRLRSMAEGQQATSSHYFGVTMLNLAMNSLVQDRVDDAFDEAAAALDALEGTTGAIEHSAARSVLASILLRQGKSDDARRLISGMTSDASRYVPNEAFAEAADAFDAYSSRLMALTLLDRIGEPSTQTIADRRHLALATARMAIRKRDVIAATAALASFPAGVGGVIGESAAVHMAEAHLALINGDKSAKDQIARATASSTKQGATAMRRIGELLLATFGNSEHLSRTIEVLGSATPWHVSFVAEDLIPHLPRMTPEAVGVVEKAASDHPDRWRTALRQVLDQDGRELNLPAARLLESFGEKPDVARLRRLARSTRRRPEAASLGRALARRLADPVDVEDQGKVSLVIGSRTLAGSAIRRKVLAMLCYLITRPDLSATRDQVLEALWPDLDPEIAVNSLNQTIYFLRRVFEENYSDDLSPGYLHHDSDVVWLDADLVTSRSVRCRQLIRGLPARPRPDDVDNLTLAYGGRFALDFEYEEWAAAYRDTLHAAYLEIVERAVLDDLTSGHYDRGITIARRALDVDPAAEQIEVCLLRLYRVTGAHSAAAEQYAHYAAVMRDELGVEPPPLESL
jgi:DNA-binding SARP family transcriptional activator